MTASTVSDELGEVRFVSETGSTNADMLELARLGTPDGFWLCAERQTAGRGRMGRRWQGGAGNLYASALLRLKQGDPPASTLALVAGVALHKALCEYITTSMLRIKWPNDIMAGPAKVSGLLLERVDDAIIIGVGVNITHAPAVEGRKTTSLHDIGADQCDATMLLHVLRRHLLTERADWRERGVAHSIKLWLERAHAPGTALSVIAPDGEKLEGCFHGLTEDGALILRDVQNKDHIIHAGDVFLI